MAQVTASRTGPLVVVLTGPECTGKSTLAGELAVQLGASLSREYARSYVDGRGTALGGADVEPIARGQIDVEDQASRESGRLLLKDTDLLSTVVYARHYYGACPAWIEQRARERLGQLYLLLAPDVPWVADGLQRDQPEQRRMVYDLFARTLQLWHAPVVEIDGTWNERRARALAAIADADKCR
jgi:NadR type nicotinamide-nucleotide adenylyltransferase